MQYKLDTPLYTSDWFEGTVLGMIFIGENDKGRKNFLTLDIITDGSHMGIVIGNSEIISASYSEKKLLEISGVLEEKMLEFLNVLNKNLLNGLKYFIKY